MADPDYGRSGLWPIPTMACLGVVSGFGRRRSVELGAHRLEGLL
jgi:hypothetical protein